MITDQHTIPSSSFPCLLLLLLLRCDSPGEYYAEVLNDVDALVGTDSAFLVGPWIEMAKLFGENATDCVPSSMTDYPTITSCPAFYEWNARVQLTTWNPTGKSHTHHSSVAAINTATKQLPGWGVLPRSMALMPTNGDRNFSSRIIGSGHRVSAFQTPARHLVCCPHAYTAPTHIHIHIHTHTHTRGGWSIVVACPAHRQDDGIDPGWPDRLRL